MKFTYKAYEILISLIRQNGYSFVGYGSREKQFVIMRHDVDFDLEKAAEFSSFERQLDIKATYMILVSTNFYNVFSADGSRNLQKILENGHGIGLHFDESKYQISNNSQREEYILNEINLLEQAAKQRITVISMHRPGKNILKEDFHIPGIENSYASEYFTRIKYISDSRHSWKEDVERIIQEKECDRLQILTHPFWYQEREQSARETIEQYMEKSQMRCYRWFETNITDMAELMAGNGDGNDG